MKHADLAPLYSFGPKLKHSVKDADAYMIKMSNAALFLGITICPSALDMTIRWQCTALLQEVILRDLREASECFTVNTVGQHRAHVDHCAIRESWKGADDLWIFHVAELGKAGYRGPAVAITGCL